jgi:ABC-type multidrug transport system ATPase subunit
MTASTPSHAGPRLQIDQLTKRYGARAALDGLSFTLQPGCFAALLGPNGAGKSTLFQVLTGLFAADAGNVAGGRPFAAHAARWRRCATSAWCSSRCRSTWT